MKRLTLLIAFVGLLLQAKEPLHISAVERQGLPPYEESDKLYRLEGSGCGSLSLGERLTLKRVGEKRSLGKLKVTAVKPGYALTTLDSPGDTYPLRGDLAVRLDKLLSIPGLPQHTEGTPAVALAIQEPKVPEELKKLPTMSASKVAASKREPIYFLKGDAHLSPGALRKLNAWVASWGKTGLWFIAAPTHPGQTQDRLKNRVDALKAELVRLGVEHVEEHSLPPEPTSEFEALYVGRE